MGTGKNLVCFVIVSMRTCTLGMLMHLTVLLEMIFFISFNGILDNGFNLKSPYEKTRFIFDQSIWECNGHWFLNIKAILSNIWNYRKQKLHSENESLDLSSNAMACIHE